VRNLIVLFHLGAIALICLNMIATPIALFATLS